MSWCQISKNDRVPDCMLWAYAGEKNHTGVTKATERSRSGEESSPATFDTLLNNAARVLGLRCEWRFLCQYSQCASRRHLLYSARGVAANDGCYDIRKMNVQRLLYWH